MLGYNHCIKKKKKKKNRGKKKKTQLYKGAKKLCSKNSLPRIDSITDNVVLFPVIYCYVCL